MSHLPFSPTSRGVAIEVLARLLSDRERGGLLPLAAYLALFPGQEEVVAAEFLGFEGHGDGSRSSAGDSSSDESGAQVVGPYRLERELGRGGQGAVWLARDPRLERLVALKIVPVSRLVGDVAPRFKREARAASSLSHPGICAVYDVGSDDSLAWIAMQYVPGQTLEERLVERHSSSQQGHPDARELRTDIALCATVGRALQSAHDGGITHRDVKPANVVATLAGEPVLLDFGVAREMNAGAPLTLAGDALGTPAYMSPEQLLGETVDGRADVWSLGVMAYELATGQRPFEASTREGLVQAVLRSEPELPSRHNPAIPRDLDVVLQTALAKEVDRRYRSALEFSEDLERVVAGRPVHARPIPRAARLLRWARRNPGIALSVAALFAVLAVGLAVSTFLLDRTRRALSANETLLAEVTQLADAKVAADLLAEEPTLWPAEPRSSGWSSRPRRSGSTPRARAAARSDTPGTSPRAWPDTRTWPIAGRATRPAGRRAGCTRSGSTTTHS